MFSGKVIFFSALDWGLGHVTRSAVLIKQLAQNNKVIIGVTNQNRDFYAEHFPELLKLNLPSYNLRYSSKWPVWFTVLLQWPKIRKVIRKENKIASEIAKEHKVEVVISDNRFGLAIDRVHAVFITHQLTIKSPFFSKISNWYYRQFIHGFNEVWVPDYEDISMRLSGDLSINNGIQRPVRFIGPLSWLSQCNLNTANTHCDLLILLSGVEPQRTILENDLLAVFRHSNKNVVLVRGTKAFTQTDFGKVQVFDLLTGDKLKGLLLGADEVICRSGYSTLMDLHLLGKSKMILVPTPGQTEQEYLAEHWKRNFGARVVLQKTIKKEWVN